MTECRKYFFTPLKGENSRPEVNSRRIARTAADIKNCVHFHILNIPSKHHILSLMGLGISHKEYQTRH